MSAAVLNVAAVDAVDILEINKTYHIIYASCIVRGTSSSFLLAILQDVHDIVKLYMPGVNDRNDQDNLIIYINTRSEKYNLTYRGRCEEELVHKFHLEPAS